MASSLNIRAAAAFNRFDRLQDGTGDRLVRIPMLSALTLLDSDWRVLPHRDWVYGSVADEMKRRGMPDSDRQELYRRMLFNALIGNSDDHPRNHAFLWIDGGWRLSPMFDVLPVLGEGPAKTLAMSVGAQGPLVSRQNLLSHFQHFALDRDQAESMLLEVAGWADELADHYASLLSGQELDLARQAIGAKQMLS